MKNKEKEFIQIVEWEKKPNYLLLIIGLIFLANFLFSVIVIMFDDTSEELFNLNVDESMKLTWAFNFLIGFCSSVILGILFVNKGLGKNKKIILKEIEK